MADEALEALTNSRSFGNTVVTLQEQFDAAAVTKLKRFHQEFFGTANPAADAKDVALEFQKRVLAEAADLDVLASHAGTYPFMTALTPIASELKALADREWSHCLKNLGEFSEPLLDAKEATVDPLKQFYAGPKRAIYDDVRTVLRDEAANFADVSGSEAQDLREILASATPYKGNALQQSKVKLDALRVKVEQVVTAARTQARARIEEARGRPEGMAEFEELTPAERAEIVRPFDSALAEVEQERLAPVIRQIADRMAGEVLPRQLQRVAELAAAKKPRPGKPGGGARPAEYVAARSIAVTAPKAVIETERELDEYLAAVRAAYLAELRMNRRITL